ncbi:MAG TPA: extracellular solute-binding protein [Clostridia bacterium]|nr:extracellular solute-binding protein [Clostridia bacterium]
MKKTIAILLCALLIAGLFGCGGNDTKEPVSDDVTVSEAPAAESEYSELYTQVMARFDGQLEEGAVLKVLENDTAIELGYVDQLIEAFNAAFADQGVSAERMNIDQYSDLATDGPYGLGPDVWYQANDILMKYGADNHLYALPIYDMECYDYIPQNAWDAYAREVNGETFYCAVPVNVQTGMLYYIESKLPENWQADWDINQNDVPDFFETYTALYAYSKDVQENGGTTEYGYLDDLVDTYFMAGYLFTNGAYVFGDNDTNPEDIGLNKNGAAVGTNMILQWSELMHNTETLDKAFASAAYSYLAQGKMLCTVTTPDVRAMFIRSMVNTGSWTEEEALSDLKMITVPRLPVSADLTSNAWQDTITDMDNLTVQSTMMGGINGYGVSAYTKYPNAALAFVEFATGYEQIIQRYNYLGISPARSDAAETIGADYEVVSVIFELLNDGYIDIMPAITEMGQVWSPCESFFIDLATDAFREERGDERLYDSVDKIQAGLDRLVQQIWDAIFTLA